MPESEAPEVHVVVETGEKQAVFPPLFEGDSGSAEGRSHWLASVHYQLCVEEHVVANRRVSCRDDRPPTYQFRTDGTPIEDCFAYHRYELRGGWERECREEFRTIYDDSMRFLTPK